MTDLMLGRQAHKPAPTTFVISSKYVARGRASLRPEQLIGWRVGNGELRSSRIEEACTRFAFA